MLQVAPSSLTPAIRASDELGFNEAEGLARGDRHGVIARAYVDVRAGQADENGDPEARTGVIFADELNDGFLGAAARAELEQAVFEQAGGGLRVTSVAGLEGDVHVADRSTGRNV
jgi:hypothetical protein